MDVSEAKGLCAGVTGAGAGTAAGAGDTAVEALVGAAETLACGVKSSVINAGDGWHEHPTQALLDLYTIRGRGMDFQGLRVVIVGDVAHSRVARSNIYALTKLGAEVRVVVGPGPDGHGPAGRVGLRVRHAGEHGVARRRVNGVGVGDGAEDAIPVGQPGQAGEQLADAGAGHAGGDRFQLAAAVNSVLAGNVGGSFALWWRMQIFYFVLFVQRFLPICPRIEKQAESGKRELERAA